MVATEGEVIDAIGLLSSGLKVSGHVSGAGIGIAYAMALSDVPSQILKQATKNLLTGKAEGMDRTFMPSAPDLLAYCEKLHRDCLALCISTERLLALPEMPAPREEDPAEAAANIERARSLLKPKRLDGEGA